MKSIIFLALIGVCACALPGVPYNPYNPTYRPYYQDRPRASLERNAAVLRSVSDVNEGGYYYAYDTENGISAEETGREANGIQAAGGYSYTGDDGQVYSIRYTADANGFQPVGAHIPTPPPIPEAIARALAENARDEASGIFDDGSYHSGKYDSGIFTARAQKPYVPVPVPAYRPYRRIQAHEVGETGKASTVKGAYSYVGDDGKSYTVTYIADEHGFRPQGDHLPTAPPIPAEIAKALEKNARDEANGIVDDGQYHEHHQPQIDQSNQKTQHQEEYTIVDQHGYYH
ncbi:cuticle protein 3-like [Aricia agestis]|uniref:cuticle protein 3-like n=1 Tax=Aricia agestis TaxID=91739 RepID=UPI001C207B99|nr:cuticle protein 3-like [Aricia agestis]